MLVHTVFVDTVKLFLLIFIKKSYFVINTIPFLGNSYFKVLLNSAFDKMNKN